MSATTAGDILGQTGVVTVGTSVGCLGGSLLVLGLGWLGRGLALVLVLVQDSGDHDGKYGGLDSGLLVGGGSTTTASTGNDSLIHGINDGLLVAMMAAALSDILDDVGEPLTAGRDDLCVGTKKRSGIDKGSGVENLGHWFGGWWWRVGWTTLYSIGVRLEKKSETYIFRLIRKFKSEKWGNLKNGTFM